MGRLPSGTWFSRSCWLVAGTLPPSAPCRPPPRGSCPKGRFPRIVDHRIRELLTGEFGETCACDSAETDQLGPQVPKRMVNKGRNALQRRWIRHGRASCLRSCRETPGRKKSRHRPASPADGRIHCSRLGASPAGQQRVRGVQMRRARMDRTRTQTPRSVRKALCPGPAQRSGIPPAAPSRTLPPAMPPPVRRPAPE